jgi:hypothetical protein
MTTLYILLSVYLTYTTGRVAYQVYKDRKGKSDKKKFHEDLFGDKEISQDRPPKHGNV